MTHMAVKFTTCIPTGVSLYLLGAKDPKNIPKKDVSNAVPRQGFRPILSDIFPNPIAPIGLIISFSNIFETYFSKNFVNPFLQKHQSWPQLEEIPSFYNFHTQVRNRSLPLKSSVLCRIRISKMRRLWNYFLKSVGC